MTDTLGTSAFTIPQERKIVTAIPGPKSNALHERRLAVVPVGVSSVLPVYIAKANGAILV
ncbi:MAG: 4-aminobutyrate aminotransferase / (S)-3-amino-2-methylpropionate transaminase / 5-aminovalerate, partial [Subtercola sp.]|nr:4-aminobutyrate aminotransferase / (S)-3-amino-2-methylpropionate transaminase / 5-aminovalerate [Subtercola sp.]